MNDATETTDLNELTARLEQASSELEGLRAAVAAGDPWPLSRAYGSEPESDWGPKEVLAHTAEMLEYWPAEMDRILRSDGPDPVPFGRVSTDPGRIGRIGRDRELPTAELFDRIAAECNRLEVQVRALSATEGGRLGVHPRLGEMTIHRIVERFLVAHLEEHVEQLRTTVAG